MIDTALKDSLLLQFRTNPAGIRLNIAMARICLNCGSSNVTSISNELHYYRQCKDCGTQFYRNVCWNCRSLVDDRDPKNPYCYACKWLKCTCTACSPRGCETNPYNRKHRLKYIEDFVPSKRHSDSCPECGGGGYAQDGGQCEYCHGSSDSEDFSFYDEDGDFDQEAYNKAFTAPPHDSCIPTTTNNNI